jgi:hypothetical protein
MSCDRWARSLLTVSSEGVTLAVTVIAGNSVAALVAVAATTANRPQAASNSFAAIPEFHVHEARLILSELFGIIFL